MSSTYEFDVIFLDKGLYSDVTISKANYKTFRYQYHSKIETGSYVVVNTKFGLSVGIVVGTDETSYIGPLGEIITVIEGRNAIQEQRDFHRKAILEKELSEMYKLAEKEMQYMAYAEHNPAFKAKLNEYNNVLTIGK